MADSRLSFRVSQELRSHLEAIAEASDRSLTEVVIEAVKAYVGEADKPFGSRLDEIEKRLKTLEDICHTTSTSVEQGRHTTSTNVGQGRHTTSTNVGQLMLQRQAWQLAKSRGYPKQQRSFRDASSKDPKSLHVYGIEKVAESERVMSGNHWAEYRDLWSTQLTIPATENRL